MPYNSSHPDDLRLESKPARVRPSEPHDRSGQDGKPDGGEAPAKPPARPRKPLYVAAAVVLLLVAAGGAALWWLEARNYESTDDAFIDARQFVVAPKIGGYVANVAVRDNQHVDTGALLVRIDPRDYEVALKQAEAQVAEARAKVDNVAAQIEAQQAQINQVEAQVAQAAAALEFARQQDQRYQTLSAKGAGSLEKAQQAHADLGQKQANHEAAKAAVAVARRQIDVLNTQKTSAEAGLAAAEAARQKARLDLEYTDVKAAQPGRIARLSAAEGQLAQPGQALMMFVPDRVWVTANFKETQITDMRPGQPVEVSIDAYPQRTLKGHVDSIQSGSGTAFSLLPAENATGNFVKVTQRIPVKIVFDEVPEDIVLGPGMSVVPEVKVR
jgi:membrane fusion protein (multidrug efflux system)